MTGHRPSSTLSAAYLHALLDHLAAAGCDADRLYGADRVLAWRGMDALQRYPVAEWDQLYAAAEAQLQDTGLPLRVASSLWPMDTGPLGLLSMASTTLRLATEALCRFFPLLTDAYALGCDLDGRAFQVKLSAIGGQAWPRLEVYTLAIVCSHARWLARRPDLVFDAAFTWPQPDDVVLDACKRLFGGSIAFGTAQTFASADAAHADLVVSRNDYGAREALHAQLQERMNRLHEGRAEVVHRTERAVCARLRQGQVDIGDVAADLGLSVRTLQNRLKARAVSYRGIVDRVRLAAALEYVGDTGIPLAEVSDMLGFALQSNFQRAFRRWTGMTPGQYRRGRPLRP